MTPDRYGYNQFINSLMPSFPVANLLHIPLLVVIVKPVRDEAI